MKNEERKRKKRRVSRKTRKPRELNFRFFVIVCSVMAGIGVFILIQHQMSITCEVKSARAAKLISEERVKQENLRVRLASLKSPARIMRIAEDELGMVEPGGVIYLRYGKAADGKIISQSSYEKRNEAPPISRSENTSTEQAGGASEVVTRR